MSAADSGPEQEVKSGPLSGLRVLDLSRVLAGPWAGQALADLGAEVIKVERPGQGDDTRSWGPPYARADSGAQTREAAYFLCVNRAKKSVTIDFTKPEGQALVHRLAEKCDIVIENFKLGGLAKYELDYETLRRINPAIVYCSITGFGQDGPYAKRAGYDFMIQGMSGLMSITGAPDHLEGGGPQKVGVAVSDIFTGLYATIGILGALHCRQRTGKGQHIDLALLDSQVAVLANQAMNYLTSGKAPGRIGNAHVNIVPYQAFATEDGYIILAVGNDAQFRKFCQVAGCPDLAEEERFATNPARVRNRDSLVPLLEPILAGRTSEYWLAALEASGVPCGPINDLEQVFADPQVKHRGLELKLPHSVAGHVPSVANPIKYSETPISYDRGPPALGEHTREVLRHLLGMTDSEIDFLEEGGVL
jgi:crotonobetainyl-CoA:carnitine CoA-transferase CaiB-like acyl-CoA transferase